MSPVFPITDADLEATARLFAASFQHIENLRRCQRHQAAMDSVVALRRLADTIRSTASEHGFMPEVLFGDLFDQLERSAAWAS